MDSNSESLPAGVKRWRRGIVLSAMALVFPAALTAAIGDEPTLQAAAAPETPVSSSHSDQHLPTIWDLQLGAHWSALPASEFIDFACGTDGGPPSIKLESWAGFTKCGKEATTGLHEVYFEYDDEQEYIGRARSLDLLIMRHEFTWVNGQPVIASALFDDNGYLAGLRMVTDPRVEVSQREKGMILGGFMFARFGEEGWDCTDLPRLAGESAFQDIYMKRDCTKSVADPELGEVDLQVRVNNYRRPGQGALAWNNVPTEGEFDSSTRFQAILAEPVPDDGGLAASAVPPANPLVEKALNCPGCDLSGVNLKRANLTGANLAGADLTGANLHAAVLAQADLTGAKLAGANLNRADLRRATLATADLSKAMLFGSLLDGANLNGANLNGALAGSSRLTRADLSGASMRAVDLRDSRLNDANFTGADLNSSWMHNAQAMRADFSKAMLVYVVAHRANFTGAKFGGVDARGADFFGSSFRDADMVGADFSFTRLRSANLFSANMQDTKLEEAELPAGFSPRPAP